MKSRSGTELARLAAALLLTLGGASAEATETGNARQAIDLAADYLVRVQTDRGFFLYDVNFETGKPSGKSSIVRQAGTAFSLAEYLAVNRSAPVRRSVRNALEALWRRSVTYRRRSQQLVSGSRSVSKARTGATALALLTETLYYRATGDGRFEAARAAWLNGLLALRLRGRGFRKTAYSKQESPYFNGEGWLALAHYYETFRDPKVATVLKSLDGYLLKTYGRKPEIGFYHWGMMAAAIRYRVTRDLRFLTFIEDQTRHYLEELRPEVKPKPNTCYALEGLLTASQVLTDRWAGSEILPALSDRLKAEVEKNLSFQLLDVTGLKPLPPSRSGEPVDMTRFKGLFFARSNRKYARVDHTQHCLSAFVRLNAMETASARR